MLGKTVPDSSNASVWVWHSDSDKALGELIMLPPVSNLQDEGIQKMVKDEDEDEDEDTPTMDKKSKKLSKRARKRKASSMDHIEFVQEAPADNSSTRSIEPEPAKVAKKARRTDVIKND